MVYVYKILKIRKENQNVTYRVTLKVLSKRIQRNTDRPKGGMISLLVITISKILLITTKQSNRLNNDTKYPWKNK